MNFEEYKNNKIEKLNNYTEEQFLKEHSVEIQEYIEQELADDFYMMTEEMYGKIFEISDCYDYYNDYFISEFKDDDVDSAVYNKLYKFYDAVKDACGKFGIISDILEDKLDKAMENITEVYENDHYYNDVCTCSFSRSYNAFEDSEEDFAVFNEVVDTINDYTSEYSKGQYIEDLYRDRYKELLEDGTLFELFE